MTGNDLRMLIVRLLVGAEGKTSAHWRRVLGPVKLYPLATHAHCNWEFRPRGTLRDVEAAEKAIDLLRNEHPYIEAD